MKETIHRSIETWFFLIKPCENFALLAIIYSENKNNVLIYGKMYCRTTSKQCHKQKRILSIHKKSFQLSLSVMLTRDRKATNKKEKKWKQQHIHTITILIFMKSALKKIYCFINYISKHNKIILKTKHLVMSIES